MSTKLRFWAITSADHIATQIALPPVLIQPSGLRPFPPSRKPGLHRANRGAPGDGFCSSPRYAATRRRLLPSAILTPGPWRRQVSPFALTASGMVRSKSRSAGDRWRRIAQTQRWHGGDRRQPRDFVLNWRTGVSPFDDRRRRKRSTIVSFRRAYPGRRSGDVRRDQVCG